MNSKRQNTEQIDIKIEHILGNILRIGVIISALVVLFGAVLYLFNYGKEKPDYYSFVFNPFNVGNPISLLRDVFDLKSLEIMKLGILLLVGTPILRVIISVIAFIYEKDLMYVFFTLIVLFVLIYSFFY
ncbi:MAG: DUF1634 domain-containing protein [Ignavibacteriaceae bacterium]